MASSILGPVTRVPYDVLTEIFDHCLPQHRLKHRQPDTTIAPILLCHVCSTWRTVALATATLWSHLSCRLTVDGERSGLEDGSWIVRKNEYAFLLWWKSNQHMMAPSLCLDLQWNYLPNTILNSELELDRVGMISLFEYISSAKYIETNEIYWTIVGLRIRNAYPIAYAVPHTLVVSKWYENFDFFYDNQIALVPNHSPPALRHLYLDGDSEIHLYDLEIPTHWSSLTHLVLVVSEMSLDYWYSLIRAVPRLQLGRFQIEILIDIYTEPNPCTLAQLSTLSISLDSTCDYSEARFPLTMFLAALHLPALRDLSLSAPEAWDDDHALGHISAVLDIVPAITTLTLGPLFLDLQNDEEDQLVQTRLWLRDAEPIRRRAPHLAHLRFVAEDSKTRQNAEDRRDAFVRNLFYRDNRWLDLNNHACPIRRVTIVDRQPSELQVNTIADDTWSRIREYVGRLPNVKVAFDVVFEMENQAVAGAWNEWGPNL